tara:strand:+ start:483 stop:3512 length:3030 start_codon:yes stop_codon:yes gene_type:complete
MDILTYINRMNQIYGNGQQAAPRYNTQQYLQGGRVGYRDAGLVDSMKIRFDLGEDIVEKLNTLMEVEYPKSNNPEVIQKRIDDFAIEFKKITNRLPTANEIRGFGASSTMATSTKKAKYMKEGINFMKETDEMKKIKRIDVVGTEIEKKILNLSKDPKYIKEDGTPNIKKLAKDIYPDRKLDDARKQIRNTLKRTIDYEGKKNIPGEITSAKQSKKNAYKNIKLAQKKAGIKTTKQADQVIDKILSQNEIYQKMSVEDIAKDKDLLKRLRLRIDPATGDVTFDGYTKKSPVRGKVFTDFELAQHAKNKAGTYELFAPDHIIPKALRKQNVGYPTNFQPATYIENSHFDNARKYLQANPDGNIQAIDNYLASNNQTIRFGENAKYKFGFKKPIVFNSETGTSNIVESALNLNKNVGAQLNLKKGTPLHTELMKYCPRGKSVGGSAGTCSINEAATGLKNELSKVKNPSQLKKFGKIGRLAGGFVGWVDAPLELTFALPGLLKGDKDEALSNTTLGLFGAGKTEMEKLKPGTALYNVAKNIKDVQDYTNNLFQAQELEAYTKKLEGMLKKYPNDPTIENDLAQTNLQKQKIIDDTQTIIKDFRPVTLDERTQSRKELRAQEIASAKEGVTITDVPFVGDVKFAPYGKPKDLSNIKDYIEYKGDPYYKAYRIADEELGIDPSLQDTFYQKDIRDRYTDLPLKLASQYGKFEKQEADELARLKKEKELLRYSAIPFAEYGPSIIRGAPKFMGFNAGGRVSFKLGGIDKGRRAFMKLLAALGIGTATAGAGLIKFGSKVAGKKAAVKTGVDIATGTSGMPSWFPALVNKVIKEGDDVTEKLATMDRQVVHTKKLPDGEEVTVYRNLDSGDIRVDYDSIDNMGQEPISLQYTKGEEVYDTGKGYLSSRKTTKEPDRFGAAESEPAYVRTGPDDAEVQWEGGDYNSVDDLMSDTSRIKNYAEGKKPTLKEIVTRKRKTDKVKNLNEDTSAQVDYSVKKYGEGPDYDDSLPDIDDID